MTNEESKDVIVFNGKRYRNVTNAAKYLGIARSTFYERGLHEVLTPVPLGRLKRIHYAEDELDRYK